MFYAAVLINYRETRIFQMASEVIEVSCKCGKKVRAPKSKAGETGKCPYCREPITIPKISEAASKKETASATPIKPSRSSKPAEIKDHAPIQDAHFEELRLNTAKRLVNPCPKCGKDNAKEATECQQCHHRLKESAVIGQKSKPSKAASKKSRWGLVLAFILIFLLGLLIGIALGPEYLDVLPAKAQILKFLGIQPKTIKSRTQAEALPTSYETAQGTQPENKAKTKELLKQWENHLVLLDKEIKSLEDQGNKLWKEHSLPVPEGVETVLRQAREQQTELQKQTRILRESGRGGLASSGPGSEEEALIQTLREENKKLAQDLAQYQSVTPSTKVTSSPYMGYWYDNLKNSLTQLDELVRVHPPFESESVWNVFQSVQDINRKMQTYPNDIHTLSELLFQTMQRKDVQKYLQKRRDTGVPKSMRQADILQAFLSTKKFILDVSQETSALADMVRNLRTATKITEKDMRDVLTSRKS